MIDYLDRRQTLALPGGATAGLALAARRNGVVPGINQIRRAPLRDNANRLSG